MNWIEIIEIRANEHLKAQLEVELKNLIAELEHETDFKISLFSQVYFKSDYMLIIVHYKSLSDHRGSVIGQRLKEALKDFGMINHSLWNEFNPLLTNKITLNTKLS